MQLHASGEEHMEGALGDSSQKNPISEGLGDFCILFNNSENSVHKPFEPPVVAQRYPSKRLLWRLR